MKKSSVYLGIIIVLGMVAAGSANAQTIYSMNYDQAILGNYSLTINGSLLLNNNQQPLTTIQATYLSGPTPPSNLNSFNTFCVDILGTWNNNPTLTPTTFPQGGQALTGWVNNGIQTAASIYNAYYGELSIASGGGGQFNGAGPSYSGQEWGAAMQLAIWTDLYGAYNPITQTGFSYNSVTDPSVPTLTTDILGSSANLNPDLTVTSTFLLATDPTASNQSFIGPVSSVSDVPEPTTLALGGLSGLALLLFRRKQK